MILICCLTAPAAPRIFCYLSLQCLEFQQERVAAVPAVGQPLGHPSHETWVAGPRGAACLRDGTCHQAPVANLAWTAPRREAPLAPSFGTYCSMPPPGSAPHRVAAAIAGPGQRRPASGQQIREANLRPRYAATTRAVQPLALPWSTAGPASSRSCAAACSMECPRCAASTSAEERWASATAAAAAATLAPAPKNSGTSTSEGGGMGEVAVRIARAATLRWSRSLRE